MRTGGRLLQFGLLRRASFGLTFGMRPHCGSERILFRVFKIVDFQVHVQLGPIQMVGVKQLNGLYGAQRLVFEVRVIFVAEKVFFPVRKEPYPEGGDVLHAYRNGFTTPARFHARVINLPA